jgi:hypothetical protein
MEGKKCRILLNRGGRLLLWASVMWAAAGLAGPVRAGAAELSGVRSTSSAIRELIDDAMWESPTFRGIVRAIGATDGIVYVEEGVCRHGVHACLLLDVTPAAGYRILRILVDRQGTLAHRGRLDLIATIGHELTHALEVLSERTLRSAAAVFLFYLGRVPTSNSAFETAAAIAAGAAVRGELGRYVTFVFQQVALDYR